MSIRFIVCPSRAIFEVTSSHDNGRTYRQAQSNAAMFAAHMKVVTFVVREDSPDHKMGLGPIPLCNILGMGARSYWDSKAKEWHPLPEDENENVLGFQSPRVNSAV